MKSAGLLPLFLTFVQLLVPQKNVLSLFCHRKECTTTLDCMKGWDICSDRYCYMIRARNITNPQQFTLRRGCIADPAELRYSNELEPFKQLNMCQRIVWKDIEFLMNICVDLDYCNICESWVEALPQHAKSAAVGQKKYPFLTFPYLWFFSSIFVVSLISLPSYFSQ